MKKLEKKKLKLSTVTIKPLEHDTLKAVVGGVTVTCVACDYKDDWRQ
jgi:hypothetical protein